MERKTARMSRQIRKRGIGNLRPVSGVLLCFVCACSPGGAGLAAAVGDLQPPAILFAGPTGASSFVIDFDETVLPVGDSCYLEPGPARVGAKAEGCSLKLEFGSALDAGAEYRVAGEAEDVSGNVTRFLFSFLGWNDNPPLLRLNEIQPGKNSSKTSPHRDYLEFAVLKSGNAGGVTVEWTSTVKDCEWRFPPCSVEVGEHIVLHLAPEGLPEEKNETGADLALSGGIDASPQGRDFWCATGALPDENALVLVRMRPGESPMDGAFYANADKTGSLDSDRIRTRLSEMEQSGLWDVSESPTWEDAFRWKPSTSRPLHRARGETVGAAAWTVGESGSQSPGGDLPAVPKRAASTQRKK